MLIGNKVKALRNKANLTLKQLADASGVQIATLSRIENLKMTGTIDSHQSIARALNVDLVELYKDPSPADLEPESKVQPASHETFTYNDKASYDILTNRVLSRKMMPIVLRIEPGGRTNSEQYQIGAERFIFVMKGAVRVYIEEESCELGVNKAMYIDASKKHYIQNIGEETAKMISVLTPVVL
ncbi:MAG: XRE family transcriptional regulator [Pirellulales bacterium]|nr:XRE family transcriptional regulator [Pirellulales bacterium]